MIFRLLLAFSLILSPINAFALSLTGLNAGGPVSSTDLFYDVQNKGIGGVKVTATQLATFFNSLFSGDCTVTSGGVITCAKVNGVAFPSSYTSNVPLIFNGSTIATGTVTGSTTKFATATGSLVGCTQYDGSGNLTGTGSNCGNGGTTAPGGSNTQVQYNCSGAFCGTGGLTITSGPTVNVIDGSLWNSTGLTIGTGKTLNMGDSCAVGGISNTQFASSATTLCSVITLIGGQALTTVSQAGTGLIYWDTTNSGMDFSGSVGRVGGTGFVYLNWDPMEVSFSTQCQICMGTSGGVSANNKQWVVGGVSEITNSFQAGALRFVNTNSARANTSASTFMMSDTFADGVIATLGTITGGSGYTPGTYNTVQLTSTSTGFTGSLAEGTIVVGVGGAVTSVDLTCGASVAKSCYPGINYRVGDVLTTSNANIGGTGSGFSVPVATIDAQTYTGPTLVWVPPCGNFAACNIFLGMGQNTASPYDHTIRLGEMNNLTWPWTFGIGVNFALSGSVQFENDTNATAFTTVCGEQIGYNNTILAVTVCNPIGTLSSIWNAGTGGTPGTYNNVAITSNYGIGGTLNVVVGAGGSVSSVTVNNPGTGYQQKEILTVASGLIGGTTGFQVPVATLATTAAPLSMSILQLSQATWADNQTCTAGQVEVDASFIYVCTATNTVKRAALSSF